ncbi:MAG TPA: methylated-DNA--[protein]-cysteine S-methyltransferase [Candidatus Thermoplasmatota archaeon]
MTEPMALEFARVESPLGVVIVAGDRHRIRGVWFGGPLARGPLPVGGSGTGPVAEAARQLGQYFHTRRTTFGLPLAPSGTPFQRRVWDELREVPYGETVSYGELARRIGQPTASRAVGAANGANPIPIIIPCHRAIGADGSMTGYGGGVERKRALLTLERGHA